MISYTADQVFDGEQLLAADSSVQVQDGVIMHLNQPQLAETHIHVEGLLLPGLINAHCHLELSHLLHKFEQHGGLISFLQSVITRRQEGDDNLRRQAMEQAEASMIQQGIVAVGDISNGLSSLALKEKGRLHYHTFVECVGLNPERAEIILQQAILLQQEFQKTHPASIVLHAPYSVSTALIAAINRYSAGSIHSIHNQECVAENELFRYGQGAFIPFIEGITKQVFEPTLHAASSVQAYLPLLHNIEHHVLVHNTFISEDDLVFLRAQRKNMFFCVCPNANLFIENTLPPLDLLLDQGCQIVLGTDSLASNLELNLFSEIRTLRRNFPHVALTQWLHAACLQGAHALGLAEVLGSFTPGKKPGLVQWKNWKSEDRADITVLEMA